MSEESDAINALTAALIARWQVVDDRIAGVVVPAAVEEADQLRAATDTLREKLKSQRENAQDAKARAEIAVNELNAVTKERDQLAAQLAAIFPVESPEITDERVE